MILELYARVCSESELEKLFSIILYPFPSLIVELKSDLEFMPTTGKSRGLWSTNEQNNSY